jgi:glutamate/tyrosine decarboxylase-like PLP-dependent enzyme
MSATAPYMSVSADARDQLDWTPDWLRRARGFPTYAALRSLGRRGVRESIERTSAHARDLVGGIGRLPGAEILWYPIINQGLVRFFDDDDRTERVIERIVAGGKAFFGPTTWRGKRAMRVSVVNWQTSQRDVERAIAAVERAIASDSRARGIAHHPSGQD